MAYNKRIAEELWRRGETDFLLHEGQNKIEQGFLKSTFQIYGVECARQLGKTFWGAKKSDQVARQCGGASIRIGTAFYTDLDAIILPAFEAVLRTCPRRLRPRYKTIGAKFVYPNGSEIRLVGLDRNPDKLRGSRLRLVLLEEAGFGDSDALRYAYESVIIPAFTHEPEARCILISTPPETGADHTFCELVDLAAQHDSYLKLTIYDNPMLTPERIEKICEDLGGKDSVAWKREALCMRIVDTTRAIVPEWKEEYEVDLDPRVSDKLFPFWHQYEFMDMGVQVDKTVVLYAYYDFIKATLVILDEVDISGAVTTTDLIEARITEKERALDWKPYRRVADNSHPLLINDLAAKGVHFVATDKEKIHEMVGELRVWVKSGRVKVHKRCKQLLGCLRTGIWDNNRKEFSRSKAYGHYDALAALVYGIRNTDQWTNPVPASYHNPHRLPIPNQPKAPLSPLGQDMRRLFTTTLRSN